MASGEREIAPVFQRRASILRISIIGTSGRADASPGLSHDLFFHMVRTVEQTLREIRHDFSHIILQSGGAAWADHIAIRLWLKKLGFRRLVLYLPCRWDEEGTQFHDTGNGVGWNNPGRTANYYHQAFSGRIACATLEEIQRARDQGALFDYGKLGFRERNTRIADCDVLIAVTWSQTGAPSEGGSLDTWSKCGAARKIHISLHDILGKMRVHQEKNASDEHEHHPPSKPCRCFNRVTRRPCDRFVLAKNSCSSVW